MTLIAACFVLCLLPYRSFVFCMEDKVLHLQLDLRARNNVLLMNLLSYSVVLTPFFMITRKFVFKLSIGLSPLPVTVANECL